MVSPKSKKILDDVGARKIEQVSKPVIKPKSKYNELIPSGHAPVLALVRGDIKRQ